MYGSGDLADLGRGEMRHVRRHLGERADQLASQVPVSAIRPRERVPGDRAARRGRARPRRRRAPRAPARAGRPASRPDRRARPRAPALRARQLRRRLGDPGEPDGGLEAEGHRRGVLAVGAPDAGRRRDAGRPERASPPRIAPRSARSSAKASRICRTSAVSAMSCVVAPLWKRAPGSSGSCAWTALTKGITGTPASAVVAAQRFAGRQVWREPVDRSAQPLRREPNRASARARAASIRSIAASRARSENTARIRVGREERAGEGGIEGREGHAARLVADRTGRFGVMLPLHRQADVIFGERRRRGAGRRHVVEFRQLPPRSKALSASTWWSIVVIHHEKRWPSRSRRRHSRSTARGDRSRQSDRRPQGPREDAHVGHREVHSLGARRRHDMRGIAGEKQAAMCIGSTTKLRMA